MMIRNVHTFGQRKMTTDTISAAPSSLSARVRAWMMKRELPATWMYFWLLSAQSFKVFGLLFALWKFNQERIQIHLERIRIAFYDDLDSLEQKALKRNPDLMLNTIQIYFKMLSTSEPHKRHISVLAKLLVTNPESVFVKRSEIYTEEGVMAFDAIDRDGNGELTRKEIMSHLGSVSRKEALKNLSSITGCNSSVLSMFLYVVLFHSLPVSESSHTRSCTTHRYEWENLHKKAREIDENTSLDLARCDYWIMLRDKGDEGALEIDTIRLCLLDFLESIRDCHEHNIYFQDSEQMKSVFYDEPLTENRAKRALRYLEPLMMACYRKQKNNKDYNRSSVFEFLEKFYDIKRSGTVDAYSPAFTLTDEIVRYPRVGDRVLVTKSGSQYVSFLCVFVYLLFLSYTFFPISTNRYGNLATVNDPYWFGRVKVVMDDGVEKSYLFSKGEIEIVDEVAES